MMNYKLKRAVSTAISLMAVGFHQSVLAIGLGDVNVQSYLGEPLKAQITVLGANELKSPSCLRLGDQSDLKNLNLKLGSAQGINKILTLSSNQVINEPIINLSIVAGCTSSVQRDYVLLLDPPLIGQSNTNQASQFSSSDGVENLNNTVVTSTVEAAELSPAIIKTPSVSARKTPAKQKKKTSASRKNNITDNAKKTVARKTKPAATATKPKTFQPESRLMISGGSGSYNQNVALRMDKNLTFTPDSKSLPMDDIELEDEVTVMNNRLAHLENQISLLQEKNLKLESENKTQAAQLAMAKSSRGFNFWPIVGAGLLFVAGYVAFTLLRRRQLAIQLENAPYLWAKEDKQSIDEDTDQVTDVTHQKVANSGTLFNQNEETEKSESSDSTIEPKPENIDFDSDAANEQNILVEDEQEFSVLDHADVFLSHGRAGLAIQLLQNHLLEFPKQSITIWLFLLDLLAKEDNKAQYEETALDCRLHYNIHIPAFSKPESTSSESLEDFPRLANGLENVWDTPEALNFLDDLIYNNRLEPRAGLPKNLIEELLVLRAIAQDNNNSADVIQLDEKKLAMVEQKEAILEQRKQQKLQEMAEAQKEAKEKEEATLKEELETDFEFTLVEK